MKNYLLSYKTCYFLHRAYRQSYIVLRERKPHREVETLPLRKRIPHKFKVKEWSTLTQKFQYSLVSPAIKNDRVENLITNFNFYLKISIALSRIPTQYEITSP